MIVDNCNNKKYLITFSKDDNIKELITDFKSSSSSSSSSLSLNCCDSFKEFIKLQIKNNKDNDNNKNIIISANCWYELYEKIENQESEQLKLEQLKQQIEPIIVYLFSGQGAMFNQIIFEIYDSEPIFKETMDLIDNKMKDNYYGYSTIEKLRNCLDFEKDVELNNNQMITQTALLMVQVSVFELFKQWGLKPSIILAHSFGEVIASYISGMFDLDTLCFLIYTRGKLQQTTFGKGRGMAWIDIGEIEFEKEYIGKLFPTIEIACLLSPSNIVVGGDISDIHKLLDQCKLNGINTKLLSIPTAFHHSVQDCLKDDVMNLKFISNPPPTQITGIKHMSTVTGTFFNDQLYFNNEYMFQNLRGQAKLMNGISSVLNHIQSENLGKNVIFIEIGPRPSLLAYIKKVSEINTFTEYFKNNPITILPSIQRDKSNDAILETISIVYKKGYKNINFNSQFN